MLNFMPHLILCTTARLSRGLQLRQQQQLSLKQTLWQTPPIMTLQQWLTQLLQQAMLAGDVDVIDLPAIYLNAVAEKMLWQQAIQSSIEKHRLAELFDVASLADAAIQANQLLVEWQISDAQLNDYFQSVETRQFLRWRQAFQTLCLEKNALESARALSMQIDFLAKTTLPLPAAIELAGFDRITPLEQRFIANLQAKNIKVTFRYSNPN